MSSDLKLNILQKAWIRAKQEEDKARNSRLEIEAELVKLSGMPDDHEGSLNLGAVKVSYSLTKKVNKETLLSCGIPMDRLGELFRWKPEIDAKAWKKASQEEKDVLIKAIETKPAKPSFKAIEENGK